MYDNCLRHLAATIRILEPTVIVAQGWTQAGNSPSLSVAQVLRVPKPERGSCIWVRTPFGELAFVALVHPSRHWTVPHMRMFEAEVVPALRLSRATSRR
jgi:uracil-DNA glycosylase